FDTLKDSDLNRLIWITKQLDNGRLFYSVLNYLETNKYYLKLLNAKNSISLDKLKGDDFVGYLSSLDKEISSVKGQIQVAENGISDQQMKLATEVAEAEQLSEKLKKQHKPLVYVKTADEKTPGFG